MPLRSFYARLALFLALQACLFTVVFWLGDKSTTATYLGSTLDKHARLQQTNPPRVVFVGGSSVAFGLDSGMIHHALSRTAVNLGIHAALGVDFILGDVDTKALGIGDVVVVSLEYEHFCADQASIDVLYQAFRARPASLRSLGFDTFKTLFDRGLLLLPKLLNRAIERLFGRYGTQALARTGGAFDEQTSIYTRQGFNRDGDFVQHWDAPVPKILLQRRIEQACKRDSFRFSLLALEKVVYRLNRFASACGDRGARVMFVYGALPEPVFRANQATIERIDETLRHKLKIRVLQSPQAAVAPPSYFFDTVYHLNRDGVTWRSGQLNRLLKEELK